MLLLLFGVIDLGRVFHAGIAITNSAREGARYVTIYPDATTTQIAAAAQVEAANSGIDLSTGTVTRTCSVGGTTVVTLPPGTACDGSAPVQVTITYPFDLILGGLFTVDQILLDRSAEMYIP